MIGGVLRCIILCTSYFSYGVKSKATIRHPDVYPTIPEQNEIFFLYSFLLLQAPSSHQKIILRVTGPARRSIIMGQGWPGQKSEEKHENLLLFPQEVVFFLAPSSKPPTSTAPSPYRFCNHKNNLSRGWKGLQELRITWGNFCTHTHCKALSSLGTANTKAQMCLSTGLETGNLQIASHPINNILIYDLGS